MKKKGTLRKDQLELLKKIVENPGDLVLNLIADNAKEFKYGDFLIFWWWRETEIPMEKAVFRLLQIREGEGEFGTDIFVGRSPDGECVSFSNTSVQRVRDEYIDELTLVYNTHDAIEIDDDHKDIGYTINDVRKVGFLVRKG